MADFTALLLAAVKPEYAIRKAAEDNLTAYQEQNFPNFVLSLALELANNDKPSEARRLAGLILKNALDAREAAKKKERAEKWIAVDGVVKAQVKAALLATLNAAVEEARHTAAQAIAKIAGIELPRKEWANLISSLLENMKAAGATAGLKHATLESLGYVCEEVPPDALEQEQVNSVLTAVVQGMRKEETDDRVRLAATRALLSALDFARSNFDNDYERNFLMQVVCEATLCADVRVRQAAFECLVSIATAYYDKLTPYVTELFNITQRAMRSDEEAVALQAIEFWSSICEEEIEIQNEADDDDGAAEGHHHFIAQALPGLVPLLLEQLTKQAEGQDEDDDVWNLAMAGGCCLGLTASCVRDAIVPLVMPYVQERLAQPDWRSREAGTFAFGSILDGPAPNKLAPLVQMGLSFLLNAMKDPNAQVKDTTAWALGRIFEFLHTPGESLGIITALDAGPDKPANLPTILTVLVQALSDVPHVAEKVCWALHNLAAGFEPQDDAETGPMSRYFQGVATALLAASERPEPSAAKRLRAPAYEALNEFIRCSAKDVHGVIEQLLPAIMQKLAATLEMASTGAEDRERQAEMQGLLCGVLQVIVQKLGQSPQVKALADHLMALLLRVLACRPGVVNEDAMLVAGALAGAAGRDFAKYMPQFYAFLELGLSNLEASMVCANSVGVVGDVCRALEEGVLPYCDGIMNQLIRGLQSTEVNRDVKPPILSCFGDIALAVGPAFEKYLPYAAQMLVAAAGVCRVAAPDGVDDETVEYHSKLRVGVLDAYSGILQGLKGDPSRSQPDKAALFAPYVEPVLDFLQAVYADADGHDDAVLKSAAGVLGDMADAVPQVGTVLKRAPFYKDFLTLVSSNEDPMVAQTAAWARAAVAKAVAEG